MTTPAVPIVEVVGVCGSGKSTLAASLTGRDRVLGEFLQLRRLDHLWSVLGGLDGLLRLLPAAIRSPVRPDLTELKLVAYLTVWPRRLAGRRSDRHGAVVLDQGPVYALSTLRRTEPPPAGIDTDGWWWQRVLDRWVRTLDLVIWLDAPDDVLWRRVQERPADHVIKGASKPVGVSFLQSYRVAFERTLDELDRRGGPRIVRFDTSRVSRAELAREVEALVSDLAKRTTP